MIRLATNKFSEDNKIGEGGFGDVYKVIINLIFSLKPQWRNFVIMFNVIFGNDVCDVGNVS